MDTRDVAILGLHAYGVSYTTTTRAGSRKAVLVAAYNVVSATEPLHRGRRCMFFCLSKALSCDCGCEGFHTWNPLLRVLAWSLQCSKTGWAPTCRHDGTPWDAHDQVAQLSDVVLPRAALLMVRGDWEWLCQCFRFRFTGLQTILGTDVQRSMCCSRCVSVRVIFGALPGTTPTSIFAFSVQRRTPAL